MEPENPKPGLISRTRGKIRRLMDPLGKALSFMMEKKKPEIIFEADSQFNHITISELDGVRTMYLGLNAEEAETAISLVNPDAPIFEYPGLLFISLVLRPKARRIVMLGLGGGFIPRLCQRYLPDHKLTVVEIDPLVVDLAGVYFGFTPGGNVQVEIADGQEYLAKLPPKSQDLIWLDAFNGDYIPSHLATRDFMRLNRRILTKEGLLAQNLHSSRMADYLKQLDLINKIFEEPALAFCGDRCANTIVINPNGPEPIPRERKDLARAAREFGHLIGPYNLLEEINKQEKLPDLAKTKLDRYSK
ncbi:MAG: fused MFS/spermidine synthase [Deltaproteobacteria bacterium]|jgi:spermidine synthase|nr:fused MFS/spermidine synthase [Deltaproteobacteria bacterium]